MATKAERKQGMTMKITPQMQPAIDAHNEVIVKCEGLHKLYGWRWKLHSTKEEYERANEDYRRMMFPEGGAA